jgi:prepilin-type N-terminal cleavage/methylation domain-containing protein
MSLNNKRGLTLLEIVIAMALSVVIMVILFAALRLGYRSQEKGADRAEITQRMRILNDRITWLIRGAYPFLIKKPDLQKIFFQGDPDSIGFVTTSIDTYGKGPEDVAGLKWVSIFTDSNGLKIREKVFFNEDVFDQSGGKEFVIDPGVRKLEFEYFDLPDDEKTGEWVTEWDHDEKKYFPVAVKVKITFEHNGKTIVMPEAIVSISARKKLNS